MRWFGCALISITLLLILLSLCPCLSSDRVALPTRIQKYTVIKSPHIFKKHRVQYEIKTHSRLMQVHHYCVLMSFPY